MKNILIIGLLLCLSSLSVAQLSGAHTENGSALVDPTRPANYLQPSKAQDQVKVSDTLDREEAATVGELRLNAIRISDSSRLAVINGKTLRPGDHSGNAKLIKINAGSVDMDVNGQQVTISLLPGAIKKRSAK